MLGCQAELAGVSSCQMSDVAEKGLWGKQYLLESELNDFSWCNVE